jgi:hypothetical protein
MRQQQQSTIMSLLARYAENRDPRSIRTPFLSTPTPDQETTTPQNARIILILAFPPLKS